MLKLVGRQAAAAYKQFTYWRTASDGTMHRMWRLGSTKAQEGFPFVNKIKYLGVKLSYGSFEQATLPYRLQEGNVKLQKVRKYVHNRRTSRPKARLHIWNATVWAAVASGLVDVRIAHPDDVSTAPAALEQARQKLKQYRDLLTQKPPTVGAPACPCPN